ncbi:hypothetical protein BROUX41_001620 [Berkeleyomyces rouxiae]|uniref:uncharacterized protein n=1 Tax=Berkeleyomyces rouxiae TaxID=2035830 RepID=UPI003B7FFE59
MKITGLYVYPIKGLRGIKLKTAPIGPQGVRYDRTFVLLHYEAEADVKRKLSLSSNPECALFSQTIVDLDSDSAEPTLVVRYHTPPEPLLPHNPAHDEPLRIPLEPDFFDLPQMEVNLYGSAACGYRMGDPYDAWFSKCFGVPVALVYLGDGQRRVLGTAAETAQRARALLAGSPSMLHRLYDWAVGAPPAPVDWITWSDAAPFLVATEASLAAVQTRMPSSRLSMVRFRPNIVVDGDAGAPWDEDFWAALTVVGGGVGGAGRRRPVFALTANCARCTSLNVDYRTGRVAAGERGAVLRALMRDRRVDTGNRWSPVFGRYAYLVGAQSNSSDGDGGVQTAELEEIEISLGDKVQVVQRNEKRDVWDWPTANQQVAIKAKRG